MTTKSAATLPRSEGSRPWKDLVVLLGTNVIVAALSYFSGVGLANRMGPTLFGEYSYIVVVGTFLAQFVVFGSDQFMIRKYMILGDEGIAKIIRVRLWNLALVVLGVVLWAFYTGESKMLYSIIFAVQALAIPAVYEVHRENRVYATLYLVERTLYMAWMWAGILFFGRMGLPWVLGSLALWSGLSVGWQMYSKRRCLTTPIRTPLSAVWIAGSGLMIFNLAKYVYGGGTRLFIKEGLGYAALGIYSAIWQFIPLATMYLAQITKSWRYRLTEAVHQKNLPEFGRLLRQTLLVVLGPMVVGSLVLLLFGENVLNLLFSKDYSGAVELFPWLVAYLLVVALDSINTLLWIALGQIRRFATLFCVFSIVCLALNFYGRETLQLKGYMSIIILSHGLAVLTSLGFLVPELKKNFASPAA